MLKRPSPSPFQRPVLDPTQTAQVKGAQVRPGLGSPKKPYESGWLTASGPAPVDISKAFVNHLDVSKSGGRTLTSDAAGKSAKDYSFFFVGGLMTNHMLGYNIEGLRRAKQLGVPVMPIRIDTEGLIDDNVEVVAAELRRAVRNGTQLVLIGHSMGGLVIQQTLAKYPELKKAVRSCIFLQTPFGGSPLSTGAESTILNEMNPASRKTYYKNEPYVCDVPTLCIGTYCRGWTTSFSASAELMLQHYGVDGDGMVLLKDAFLPGAFAATVKGVNHLNGTLHTSLFQPYAPGDFMQAMINSALGLPPAPASTNDYFTPDEEG